MMADPNYPPNPPGIPVDLDWPAVLEALHVLAPVVLQAFSKPEKPTIPIEQVLWERLFSSMVIHGMSANEAAEKADDAVKQWTKRFHRPYDGDTIHLHPVSDFEFGD